MFIDSHCHLDFPVFKDDLDKVLQAANSVGVSGFLVPSTTYQSWDAVNLLGKQYPSIRTAFGYHPYFLETQNEADLDLLEPYAALHNAVAIGEIGLDYWEGHLSAEKQEHFFIRQLDIAQNLRLPVILHARKSYDQVFSLVKKYQPNGGIIHAFTGSLTQAKKFIDLGFILGIGGVATYERAKKVRRMLVSLSDDDFVLETDSPDMPVFGFQGERNSPDKIITIAQCIADLREQDINEIALHTSNNVLRILSNWNSKGSKFAS